MRVAEVIVASAVVALGAALLPGCLANRCLLTYCDGPGCGCTVSTCGEGAAFDERIQRCRCLPGRVVLGGHCTTPAVAAAYCGPGYRFERGGCYANQCRPGDELDQTSGLCIPHEQVNQVATNMGVNVGAGQKLGCPAGQKLVLDGPNAACVPLAQTCAPDETFDGRACVKPSRSCPEGSAWDAARNDCVGYAKESPSDGPTVDVARWAVTRFGADGGDGTPAFCNAFARKPWSFGVNEGSMAFVRVAVTLAFPGAEIARGTVSTGAVFAASGTPVLPKGASEVQAAARTVFAPLLGHGGKASAPSTTLVVRCAIANAARPGAVPATGGL
jgi:hypothetical protein